MKQHVDNYYAFIRLEIIDYCKFCQHVLKCRFLNAVTKLFISINCELILNMDMKQVRLSLILWTQEQTGMFDYRTEPINEKFHF